MFMKNKTLLKILFVFVLAATVLACQPAWAQVSAGLGSLDNVAGETGLKAIGGGSVPNIIGAIIKVVLGVLGAGFLLLTIYAGFTWMTAQGDEKKVDQAKKIIINALIGMLIVGSAWAITNFVLGQLQKVSSGATTTTATVPKAQ